MYAGGTVNEIGNSQKCIDCSGVQPMGNKGNVKIKLSPESGDAISRISDMETWTVQPTMVRGRKPLVDPGNPSELSQDDVIRRKYKVMKGKKTNPGGTKGAEAKTKKHILKAKAPRPEAEVEPEGPPTASDYRRSKASRALITKRLEELNRLDCDRFPQNPLFDVDGNCRMKGAQDVTWQLLKLRAGPCFETMSPRCKKYIEIYKDMNWDGYSDILARKWSNIFKYKGSAEYPSKWIQIGMGNGGMFSRADSGWWKLETVRNVYFHSCSFIF